VIVVALVAAGPVAAEPAERTKIAVIALASGDVPAQLADDLIERIAAEVARRGGMEIAGKEEFRARLGVTEERRAVSCLAEMPCLSRVGTELGVTRILAATIGRRGGDYLLALNLIDLASARTEGRVFKQVTGGIPALIREAKDAIRKVFIPVPEPGALRVSSSVPGVRIYLDDVFIGTTPLEKTDIPAGSHRLRAEREGRRGFRRRVEVPAGAALELAIEPTSLPERPRWPAIVAWSALSGAAGTALAGTFVGVLSQGGASSPERNVRIMEVDKLESDATKANILFVTAGVLAATSATVFWLYRTELFEESADLELAASPRGLWARLRF
jgi:hypothetical protein